MESLIKICEENGEISKSSSILPGGTVRLPWSHSVGTAAPAARLQAKARNTEPASGKRCRKVSIQRYTAASCQRMTRNNRRFDPRRDGFDLHGFVVRHEVIRLCLRFERDHVRYRYIRKITWRKENEFIVRNTAQINGTAKMRAYSGHRFSVWTITCGTLKGNSRSRRNEERRTVPAARRSCVHWSLR